MDEELEIGSKRVPSNITYPPAGHYVVRRMRELEERISCYVINDNDKQHILREQQRIYFRAEKIQQNHNHRDRRRG